MSRRGNHAAGHKAAPAASQDPQYGEPLRDESGRSRAGRFNPREAREAGRRIWEQMNAPIFEAKWFKQGGACMVARSWSEVMNRRMKTQTMKSEEVLGRLLGFSRNGRIWVLVHIWVYAPPNAGSWWELRLVDPEQIRPVKLDICDPPPLPDAWRQQLGAMSLDKALR